MPNRLVSRLADVSVLSPLARCVIQLGIIKVIPLSPPCSALRDLLNATHCHLICDQGYNGSGKIGQHGPAPTQQLGE